MAKKTPEELQQAIKEWERKRTSVTMAQARLALNAQGLLAAAQTALEALPEPARANALIEWEYSTQVDRNSPWVIALGPGLGLTDEDIDNLFVLATTL